MLEGAQPDPGTGVLGPDGQFSPDSYVGDVSEIIGKELDLDLVVPGEAGPGCSR